MPFLRLTNSVRALVEGITASPTEIINHTINQTSDNLAVEDGTLGIQVRVFDLAQ